MPNNIQCANEGLFYYCVYHKNSKVLKKIFKLTNSNVVLIDGTPEMKGEFISFNTDSKESMINYFTQNTIDLNGLLIPV